MAEEIVTRLVSRSADFISIDKTVVAEIDEAFRRVLDGCVLVDAGEDKDFDSHSRLSRIALEKLNDSLDHFHEIFKTIGVPAGRRKS